MGKLLFASTLFLLSGCSAISVQHAPEYGRPYRFASGSRNNNFDCDADAGKYSELNEANSGTNPWITGFMQLVTPRPDSAWPPDAGVVFAGKSKLPRVGLEVFVLPDKPATLQIAVRGAGGAGDHTVFASMPVSGAPVRFALRLSDSGQLSLSVGDATTTLSIGSVETTRVNLYCSSAHVHFSDVLVGSDNK